MIRVSKELRSLRWVVLPFGHRAPADGRRDAKLPHASSLRSGGMEGNGGMDETFGKSGKNVDRFHKCLIFRYVRIFALYCFCCFCTAFVVYCILSSKFILLMLSRVLMPFGHRTPRKVTRASTSPRALRGSLFIMKPVRAGQIIGRW